MSKVLLQDNPQIVQILEKDLIEKALKALNANSISAKLHGVFSLDDLEAKTENDLDGFMAVGVGYQGCRPVGTQDVPAGGNRSTHAEFLFMILFAAPTDAVTTQRHDATTMLSVLRRGIMGSPVAGSISQRPWQFVEEKPVIDESTRTMLYYTQVWRVKLPVNGN